MIILELLIEADAETAEDLDVVDLPVAVHVHKRLEQFRYLSSIFEDSIPIGCLRNAPINALRNLLVVNKSHSVVANSSLLFSGETRHDRIVGSSYSSAYADVVATNQTFVDSRGRVRPLFYRHALPEGVTEATLSKRTQGNKELPGEGYVVDIERRSIFTNHRNIFDQDSRSYKLFFVSGSTSDGAVFNTLLNPIPVAKEATWEDIDLETGDLVDDYPLFTKTPSGRGYTFYFNEGDEWFIRLHDKGLIQPRRPRGNRPDSPWFMRFTNGDVSAVVNGAVRHYRIPEFSTQPFVPYKPLLYGTREDLSFVNRRVLQATRKQLSINLELGLHLEIQIEDPEGNILYVYSTDDSRAGERIVDLDVFVEVDKIASWDNPGGFIQLATDIQPGWVYYAKYYYEADDYEYTMVNLNPITNKRMQDHIYVFYCVPDVDDADQAVHHLLVDYDGIIVEASQSLGVNVPNLQLRESDGVTWNPNTVIGMKYFSETESNFLDMYAAGYGNSNGYLILAEVCSVDTSLHEDQIYVDVRRAGGVIADAYYRDAIRANPRILQSHLGYGETGQVVPEVNVMILEPSVTLLEDYGGLLTQVQAETLLKKHMPVSGYPVIRWVYPKTILSATSFTAGEVEVVLTWEGVFTYRLWRKEITSEVWVQVYETTEPPEGAVEYTDTGLTSGVTYQYAASLLVGSTEFPLSNAYVVVVR